MLLITDEQGYLDKVSEAIAESIIDYMHIWYDFDLAPAKEPEGAE